MERQTTAPLLNFNMWPIRQESMVNVFSALNNNESDIIFEVPPSCKPNDFLVPLLSFNDSQIDDIAFFKPFETIIMTVLFPTVFTFGFIGNVAFLTVVVLVREMRILTNLYLANLAVTDLLFIGLFLTLVAVSYALSNGVRIAEIERTDLQCRFNHSVLIATYIFSLCLVTLVTFARFLAICHPLRYRINNTKNER